MNEIAKKNGAIVFPDDPKGQGSVWTEASFLRKWLGACRANAIITKPGSGITLKLTRDGLDISSSATADTKYAPFQLVAWSDSLGNPQLLIYAGSIDGAGSGMPGGFTNSTPIGNYCWLGSPNSGTRFIHLLAHSSGGSYTSSEIVDSASDSLTTSTGDAAALIGTYTYDGSAITPQNLAYGPGHLTICRAYYVSSTTYNVSLNMSGGVL